MRKIIITGHGHYATGMKSALELLAGPSSDIIAVDFTIDMNEDDLQAQFQQLTEQIEVIFVCDILGGTPYKQAAIVANKNDQIEVVAGCNLGSVLEATFKEHTPISELVTNMVNVSKQSTVQFKKVQDGDTYQPDNSFEVGI